MKISLFYRVILSRLNVYKYGLGLVYLLYKPNKFLTYFQQINEFFLFMFEFLNFFILKYSVEAKYIFEIKKVVCMASKFYKSGIKIQKGHKIINVHIP